MRYNQFTKMYTILGVSYLICKREIRSLNPSLLDYVYMLGVSYLNATSLNPSCEYEIWNASCNVLNFFSIISKLV